MDGTAVTRRGHREDRPDAGAPGPRRPRRAVLLTPRRAPVRAGGGAETAAHRARWASRGRPDPAGLRRPAGPAYLATPGGTDVIRIRVFAALRELAGTGELAVAGRS